MADRADVPASPNVSITVDEGGRVTINGHHVPREGAVDPRRLATDIVCADFAQPLGRPVRAIATFPDEQVRMLIHPDGRVTEVESQNPATPAGVPPATRAPAAAAGRDPGRVAAEVAVARHAGRRRPYPLLVGGVGTVAAAAALLVVWDQRAPATDQPEPAAVAPRPEPAAADVAPAQPLIESRPIRPFAVTGVSAASAPGTLNLNVSARRRTTVRVVVAPATGSSPVEQLQLTVRGDSDREVTVSDLDPGRYRWKVLVPGQPQHSGVADIPAVPPPVEVVTVSIVDQPAASTDGSGDGDGPARDEPDDVQQPIGVSSGPNHPVDPDGD